MASGASCPHNGPLDSGAETDDRLLLEVVEVAGHSSLTVTSDPLGAVYPFCVGRGLWAAGLHLVEFFNRLPDHLVREKCGDVLELGAGLGVAGMALARKGARVCLTDVAGMLPLLDMNVSQNFHDRRLLSVQKLDWCAPADINNVLESHDAPFNIVIGSDVAYDEEAYRPLIATICRIRTAIEDIKVILSIPDRPETRAFFFMLKENGLSWRVLHCTRAADMAPEHDCLVLEVFGLPVPERAPLRISSSLGMAATVPTLLVCDFDWSLVEENSDTFVLEQLGALEYLRQLEGTTNSWTQMMDRSLVAAHHNLGATESMVRAAARKTPMSRDIASVLRALGQSTFFDIHILSDANSVFISEILQAHDLTACVDEIHTNPARFDHGALRVVPFHDKPHGCHRCPANLCKGAVMEELLMRKQYMRVVYVGDGSNDFCPSCRTGPLDIVLARTSYPDGRRAKLLQMLESTSSTIVSEAAALEPGRLASGDPYLRSEGYTGQECHALVYPWSSAEQLAYALRVIAGLVPMEKPNSRLQW